MKIEPFARLSSRVLLSLLFLSTLFIHTPTTFAYTFTSPMGVGSTGEEVVQLQTVLVADGFLAGKYKTAYYGYLTQDAVKQYQIVYNITPADGNVGTATLAALNSGEGVPGAPPSTSVPTSPTVTLSISPPSITSGSSATISWTSTNATSCITSGFSGSGTSGSASVSPTTSTTYSVTCMGSEGSATGSATISEPLTVTPATVQTPTVSLTASPTSITSGGSSTLTWSSTNASSCVATGFTGTATTGSATVSPTTSTTYSITCTGTGGSATGSATVSVTATTPAPTVSLTASPTSITSGGSSTLTWSSTNASSCVATGFTGTATTGSATVSPTTSTTYSITCTGTGGSATGSATVSVTATTPAPTVSLTASPTSITSGGSSTLTWSSTNASSCVATGFTGTATTGSATVSPTTSTTYSITCTGTGGSATGSATVSVTTSGPPNPSIPPILNFSSLNCPSAPASFTTAFYVDPNAASSGQNGSQSHPWTSLATVLSTQVGGSGPVQPGDVIYLNSGNYGDVTITNVNNAFIGLEAASGQTPVFHTLTVNGARYWYIHGIKIQPGPETGPNHWIVTITPNGQSLPVNNIILDGNTISTVDSTQGWTTTQWQTQMANGLHLDMNGYTGSGCVEVTNNAISNVTYGSNFGIDNSLFSGNTINNFGDDALDFTGYNNLFMTNNTFTNSNNDGDGNHEDFFQGYTAGERPVIAHSNILISGNTLIRQTGATGSPGVTAFPANIQGIDIFDGQTVPWNNVQVLGNTIITSSYWGIGLLDTDSGLIANNTVLDDGSNVAGTNGQLWIQAGTDGDCGVTTTPTVTVENNIAPILYQKEPTAKFTHNFGTQSAHCVNGSEAYDNNTGPNWTNNVIDSNLLSYLPGYHPTSYQFNVTPAAGSPAANYGVTAPTTLVSESTTLNRSTLLASVGAGIAELIQTLNNLLHE